MVAFVAPHLVRELGFEKASLGLLFSAGLVGMMIGAGAGGFIADRVGRRSGLIVGCALFGAATLAMLSTTTLSTMALCRFVAGVGMGAALATALALAAEFAPQRLRGRVIALVGMATPMGSIVPGLLTATLVPSLGWHVLLVIGGAVPLLLAAALLRCLPESIKYLALHPRRHEELLRTLGRVAPGLAWAPSSPPVGSAAGTAVSPLQLLSGGLAPLTLLLWLLLFCGAMALYLINSWLPLVLENVGLSARAAGAFSALFGAGGLVGILGVALLFRRAGALLLPTMFLIAVPFLLGTVRFDTPRLGLFICLLVPGIALGAIMVLCNVIPGIVYPTAVRATGVGLVLAAGRVGAIAGPLVGAAVFALDLPPQRIFAVAALPLALGAVGAIALALICYRRYGGIDLREASLPRDARRADPVPHASPTSGVGHP